MEICRPRVWLPSVSAKRISSPTGNWTVNLNGQSSKGNVGALRVGTRSGYITGTTDLRDDNWHHVATILMDDGDPMSSEIQLYVDGAIQDISNQTTLLISVDTLGDKDIRIERNFVAENYFDGFIDDVRLYDQALTVADIKLTAGLPNSPPPAHRSAIFWWTPIA